METHQIVGTTCSSTLGYLLGFLYMLGLYTCIDLVYPPNRLLCTNYPCGIAGLLLLALNWRRIRRNQFYSLAGLNMTALASIILSPELPRLYVEGIKSYLQLTYSILIAYFFYLETIRWPETFLRRLFGWATVLILVGCALEIHAPPFRAVSDAFRHTVHARNLEAGQDLYEANERDLELANHIRPSLFTQEPSYVALALLTALTVWFALARTRAKTLFFCAALALGMHFLCSPILLGALPVYIATQSLNLRTTRTHAARTRMLLVCLVVPAVVVAFAGTLFSNRATASGSDQSTINRISLPYSIAMRSLLEYPVFGVGLGEIETHEDAIYREAVNANNDADYIRSLPVNVILCNAFCDVLIFFGIVGTLVLCFFLFNAIRFLGDRQYGYVVIILLTLTNAQGSCVNPRVWSEFLLLLAVAAVKGRSNRVEGPRSGPPECQSWLGPRVM